MTLKQTLEKSHKALTDSGVEHALIGGFALAVLGVPRTTNDIDFLIHETKVSVAKAAMEKAGWKVERESKEVIHFSGQGNVDFLVARRPLSQEMLKASKPLAPLGVNCVSPEAVIGLKIQAYKNDPSRVFQDKADIQALMKKHHASLDWKQIETFANLFGEMPFIESLRGSK